MKTFHKLFLFLFLTTSQAGYAYHYEAALPAVTHTGFYKIQLLPEVNSRLKPDFSDLRLYDHENKEIPYFLQDENPVITTVAFKEYSIVEKSFVKDSITKIILHNPSGERINNISLRIANAEVQKTMTLAGSYDQNQWFVVKESDLFTSISNASEVSEFRMINFPLSDYFFYKIEINDKRSAPINILKAGAYESITTKGSFTLVKSSWSLNDSSKKKQSWIRLQLEPGCITDVLEMDVSAPAYYVRNAAIYRVQEKSTGKSMVFVQSVVLNSKTPVRIALNGLRAQELWIAIDNHDNPSLTVNGIRAFQVNHYCIASLEKGKYYTLRFSDSLLAAPEYDLKFFRSAIPASLKTIVPAMPEERMQTEQHKQAAPYSLFSDKRFIWAALVLVVIILAMATLKMMKELN
jgi:hypothetical protein